MPTITNTTKRPIRVRLPGGKTLHLGPGQSGKIAAAASEYPPVVALVEAGDAELELKDGGRAAKRAGGGSIRSSQDTDTPGGIRHTGDR